MGNYLTSARRSSLKNPGTVDDLHKECLSIMPVTFEGFEAIVVNDLGKQFQLSHTIFNSSDSKVDSAYRIEAKYVGAMQMPSTEPYPVVEGEIDLDGNWNATIIHQLVSNLRCKMDVQFRNRELKRARLSADYIGRIFTASLDAAEPDISNRSGTLMGQFLLAVTNSLSIGAELGCVVHPNLPGGYYSGFCGCARYVTDKGTWSGSVGGPGCQLCYYQKASSQLQFGVEFGANNITKHVAANFACQIDLPEPEIVFRGKIDTELTVAAVLEKKLPLQPLAIAISGYFNPSKSAFALGCGITMG